jgi:citrate synthase
VCCISRISFIDGDKGILQYRGIPIEQLAESASLEEVYFLLIYGELPSQPQLDEFSNSLKSNAAFDTRLDKFILAFDDNMTFNQAKCHPMAMMSTLVSVFSGFYPEANPAFVGQNIYKTQKERDVHIHRMLGCIPAVAASIYNVYTNQSRKNTWVNNSGDKPLPDPKLGYVENFLAMIFGIDHQYTKNSRIIKAVEILFILHAEHELNCSTAAVRHMESSVADVYTTLSGAVTALYGPRHGGANEAVLKMLEEIGSKDNVPQFIADVKAKKKILMGFGHRVYKNFDPRAKLIRSIADDVFKETGKVDLIDIATELESIALQDDYFISRKLYPNVDFYSGVIYKALGIPSEFFTVLFALPRFAGWLAHWNEFAQDPDNRIVRPRQIYKGHNTREFVTMTTRRKFAEYKEYQK